MWSVERWSKRCKISMNDMALREERGPRNLPTIFELVKSWWVRIKMIKQKDMIYVTLGRNELVNKKEGSNAPQKHLKMKALVSPASKQRGRHHARASEVR